MGSTLQLIVIGVILFDLTSSTVSHRNKITRSGRQSSPNALRIGAYRKNFRGDISKVISEVANSEIDLPELRYEDNTWEGVSIELECNASYPVQWVYNGPGAPIIHTTTSRSAGDYYNVSSYVHSASVVFSYTTEMQTGLYTCQGVGDTGRRQRDHAEFYVYVPGSSIFLTSLRPHESRVVTLRESEPWALLPCPVTKKDAYVRLYKLLQKGSSELPQSRNYLMYDPRAGFRYNWQAVSDPTGEYFCSAESHNGKFSKVHLRLEVSKIEIASAFGSFYENSSPEAFDLLEEDTPAVEFIHDALRNRITCCSLTKGQRPKLKGIGCRGIPDCQIRHKYLQTKSCPPTCEQHVVNVSTSCVAYVLSDWHDSGLLECSVPGSASQYFQYSKDDEVTITNFTRVPATDGILKMTTERSPKAGHIYISCFSNPFFFSTGLKWAWQERIGAPLDFVHEAHFPPRSYLEVPKQNVTGSRLYCFAPIWNSATEWRNTSILIN